MIDLPLFFGTTLSHRVVLPGVAARDRAACAARTRSRAPVGALGALPLVMSLGIGLCVNQTRAVLEALFGRETEFVRTPKHGIRGKLETWSGKKYRAAKSLTPFIELAMAAYFVVAIARRHRPRPLPVDAVPGAVPLRLRLRRLGVAVAGRLRPGPAPAVAREPSDAVAPAMSAPLVVATPDATPCPVLLAPERLSPRRARARGENDPHERASV